MTKIIILAMLMLLPILTIAQTESKTTYANADSRGKQCKGGSSFCSGTIITIAKEQTTASVAKAENNMLQMSLDKAGFAANEWEELLESKTFPVDDDSITVSKELLKTLKMDSKFNIIKKGQYRVAVLNDKAIVEFELIER